MASYYQKALRDIAPDLNPAGVEASMRLHYGTLSHLPQETFVAEAAVARECRRADPAFLERVASSMGLGSDYDYWEALRARRSPFYPAPPQAPQPIAKAEGKDA